MSRTKKAATGKTKTTKDAKKPSPAVSSTKAKATTKRKETSKAPKICPESVSVKAKGKEKPTKKGSKMPAAKSQKPTLQVENAGKTIKTNAVVAKPQRGEWACLTCTYFNSDFFYSCEMCFTPRGAEVQTTDDSEKPDVRLEFEEGTSSKFWNLKINGCTTIITYGKIGTQGQTDTKIHANEATARKFAAKIQAEKEKKGYRNAFDEL